MTSASLLAHLRAALTRAEPQADALSGIASAVLVPLFVRDDGLHLLFTKRSEELPHHSGQVAFPGGRYVAATDTSLVDTALRESHEEIGLDPAHVQVLGPLAPIHTFVTNFVINPFVGVIPHPYDFRANAREVSDIFSVPLDVLADPAAALEEEWQFGDRRFPVTAFRHEGFVIWGATQKITAMLLEVLAAIRTPT